MNTNKIESCSSISSPLSGLEDMYVVKASSEQKSYLCKFPDCGRLFRYKSEIMRHVATHAPMRPFTCEFESCGKAFKRQDALQNHMRIHTNENPFACEVEGCGKTFPTKASLRYHLLKHKDEKTYACSHPGCEKSFLTLFQLKQHERADNLHKKIKTMSEANINKPERATTKFVSDASHDSCVAEYAKPCKIDVITEAKNIKRALPVILNENCSTTPGTPSATNTQSLVVVDETMHPLFRENVMLKKRLEFTERLLMNVLQNKPATEQKTSIETNNIANLAQLLLLQRKMNGTQ